MAKNWVLFPRFTLIPALDNEVDLVCLPPPYPQCGELGRLISYILTLLDPTNTVSFIRDWYWRWAKPALLLASVCALPMTKCGYIQLAW
jgi:hypothetical protein